MDEECVPDKQRTAEPASDMKSDRGRDDWSGETQQGARLIGPTDEVEPEQKVTDPRSAQIGICLWNLMDIALVMKMGEIGKY